MGVPFGEIWRAAGAEKAAAAWYDAAAGEGGSYHGDWWFHAASTIKVAVLVATFSAVARGRFELDDPVHVRNRFLSVVDGSPYRIDRVRDSDATVHAQVGRLMTVGDLATRMIVASSNLATNLLVDLIGLEEARADFDRLGVQGVELERGVEDEQAWAAGINNRVTANGLVALFRLIHEGRAISADASRRMLTILHQQQFKSGIPAGLPAKARVAHKTGEISTIAHDAGLVYLPRRRPIALAVLTQWEPGKGARSALIAAMTRALFESLVPKGHR